MNKKKKTIGIIGLGNFGSLIAVVLSEDYKVRVYNYSKDLKIASKAKKIGVELVSWEETASSDIVIISTPISITRAIIKKIAPNLKRGSLLLDVCSVKVYPCDWLKKYTPKYVDIMGTHPMFGPTTSKFDIDKKEFNIKDKQIVLCPLRIKKDRQKRIEKFLKGLGLEVIITTPKDHDYQNAKTLSLVHFLGRSLINIGVGEQKIYTPGYSDVLKILPHTNNDNWQLFYDMNNFNPYASQVRNDFIQSCLKIEDKIVKSNFYDKFDFNREMIGRLDNQIFNLIEKRMKYVRELSTIKKERGIKVLDKEREDSLIKRQIKKLNLSNDFIKNIYKLIFKESYKNQK